MKNRWRQLSILLLLLLSLGVAANTAARRYFHTSIAAVPAPVQISPWPQAEPDERPPQIRTSAVSLEFTAQTQPESAQDAMLTRRGYSIADGRQSATLVFSPQAVTLDAPAPFLALSAAWTAESTEDARLTVSLRASAAGSPWGEWLQSSLDGDPRTHSGLFFLPADSGFIQCRIEMQRNPRGDSPVISGIRFRFISPGATTRAMFGRMQNLPQFAGDPSAARNKIAGVGGAFPKPALVSRTAWGCPDGERPHRGEPSYTTVTHLIVHHTATGNEANDWPAVVRSIWNFHVFTNGWSDIGYNYLVDPNGLIYEGRAGGDNVLGAHFSCANSGTMGTALLGTFTTAIPAEKALTSLKYLLAWKSDQRAIDPLGSTFHGSTQLNLQNISGHRDANASTAPMACPGTECPGNALYPLLPVVRSEVKGFTDPADDFSLSTAVSSISLQTGSTGSLLISTATVKGQAQTVRLEISGLPAGVTATINPPVITSGASATLRLSVAANAAGGTYPLSIAATGTTIRARQLSLSVTGTITTVSAADYGGERLAREAIVAAFGAGLSSSLQTATTLPLPLELAGVSVKVRDSAGTERAAPLFFVAPGQINFQIPQGTATGTATVTVMNGSTVVALGAIQIAEVRPSLFSANADGSGVAAALALRVKADRTQSYEPVAQFDDVLKRFIARPLDLSTDQVYLILFGTGIRHRSSEEAVQVRIGGTDVQVFYAGEQGAYAGLDQINALLPASLSGRGEVEVEVTVDGQRANVVRLSLK